MMKKGRIAGALLSVATAAGLFSVHGAYAQSSLKGSSQMRTLPLAVALSNRDRPASDRAMDASRKPAALLAFAGIAPGMKVADLMPGHGYFTRIFSNVVGKNGHVYAVVAAERVAEKPDAADPVKAIASDPAFSNVTVLTEPMTALSLSSPVDVVWTSQNYHDVYGRSADAALAFDRSVFKALRPGGVFIVIDHAAVAGSGETPTRSLHRIDPALIRAQVEKAGFVLESESSILKNPSDSHETVVFDPSIKGHTDQAVFKFRKPVQ
ncbi:class I SAM-dependent methyltransferase [Acetobacter conturbans]|uniref:Methyltransferase n=1 Tax=Acetobacter conturbans TaxID=1737472 RepID=A0ABX0K070_9PROT|nr:class I SAM-dependent methyltransferase [Acetobacter conturbans]NHN88504.1 methyltransferase [Acetobacter conturbans]